MKQITRLMGIGGALALCALHSWTQLPTRTFVYSCGMLGDPVFRGHGPIHHQTRAIIGPDGRTSAFADIDVRYEEGAPIGEPCTLTSRLLITDKMGRPREVERYSERTWNAWGVEIVGFSPDGSKVAADFFRMPGDYTTVPRPVVADLKTGTVRSRDLEDRITKLLPGCDYQQNITGVTDGGEIIVHIPANQFPEPEGGGCSDQGLWVFNVTTGGVHRLQTDPRRGNGRRGVLP